MKEINFKSLIEAWNAYLEDKHGTHPIDADLHAKEMEAFMTGALYGLSVFSNDLGKFRKKYPTVPFQELVNTIAEKQVKMNLVLLKESQRHVERRDDANRSH